LTLHFFHKKILQQRLISRWRSGRTLYMLHEKYNCRETEGGPVFAKV